MYDINKEIDLYLKVHPNFESMPKIKQLIGIHAHYVITCTTDSELRLLMDSILKDLLSYYVISNYDFEKVLEIVKQFDTLDDLLCLHLKNRAKDYAETIQNFKLNSTELNIVLLLLGAKPLTPIDTSSTWEDIIITPKKGVLKNHHIQFCDRTNCIVRDVDSGEIYYSDHTVFKNKEGDLITNENSWGVVALPFQPKVTPIEVKEI